jgi:hypothetical protein
MSTNIGHPSKPPRDFVPWIYWALFMLVVPVAVWMANKPVPPKPQVSLPLFNREVPAYHIITLKDISMKWIDKYDVTTDTVHTKSDLVGHYTLNAIHAYQPIHASQIGPKPNPRLIANTLAVALPANSATILGGNLQAGDIVSIAAIPLSNTTSLPTIIFDAVLVLDIKSVGSQTVIILALPANRWLDYLTKTRNTMIVLARQVG